MSWQAFSWTELQARAPRLPERLAPCSIWVGAQMFELLSYVAAFLTPFALMEGALGCWRLGADLGWAGAFFINSGVLSHWQVWFALSAFTQIVSVYLNRVLAQQAQFVSRQK